MILYFTKGMYSSSSSLCNQLPHLELCAFCAGVVRNARWLVVGRGQRLRQFRIRKVKNHIFSVVSSAVILTIRNHQLEQVEHVAIFIEVLHLWQFCCLCRRLCCC